MAEDYLRPEILTQLAKAIQRARGDQAAADRVRQELTRPASMRQYAMVLDALREIERDDLFVTVGEEGLAEFPASLDIAEDLAAAYRRTKQPEARSQVWRRSAAARPDDARPLWNLAASLWDAGHQDEARETGRKAIAAAKPQDRYLFDDYHLKQLGLTWDAP